MEEIRIKTICALRTFRQSPAAICWFLAGLWLAAWFTVITWFAEGFQGYFVQQVMFTALYFAWLFTILTAAVSKDRSGHATGEGQLAGRLPEGIWPWLYCGAAVFVPIATVALLSERYSWTFLRLELGSAFLSTFILPFFVYFVYRKSILGIALIPAIAITLVAGIALEVRLEGDWWKTSIVLLPALLFAAASWSGLGLLLLQWAERSHTRNRVGPFMEFVSMTFLFVPLMWSVLVFGESLPDSETWQPVCVTVIGVLMTIIVSDPLRRFLKACWDPSSSD